MRRSLSGRRRQDELHPDTDLLEYSMILRNRVSASRHPRYTRGLSEASEGEILRQHELLDAHHSDLDTKIGLQATSL